ncbi:NADP-dependent oxidoreductase domain-containing protein [Penicillium cosmopolitanum]|uniref:NADP-dependent oxidoreductase domain-containing protein n=1 Tax=Penicillium cosmopolitanum TaxID=1131564 RepID=A0A9W9SIZ5_9EURO|nr:NADP-dependent oxidoreductase domain-containing protein [Penicillium cosmopolitanum]KAJ5379052.1 NADP-dependent oxidoreductase domain-containing protein [Penicillium cosmopolitanum]
MSLPLRTLGRNGPQVNAVGLGLMSIGGIYGAASSTEEGVAFLEHAHATGQRFWDTADLYLTSEDIVGEWIKRTGKRNDIFLATKFAIQLADGAMKVRSDPEYVKLACEKSLKRLNIDTIDLYYCHRVDGVTPIEKTIEAMVELKNQGKIRYIGLFEVSAATLRRAHAVHPITALQIEYSPFALDIESPNSDILDTCRELGIAVVAYSPIGRGILTGQIKSPADFAEDDFRRFLPKYTEENFPKILQLVDGLKEVAKVHNSTPSQIAIAWLLAQGSDIVPIPGTRTTARMDENTASTQSQLSSEEERKIRELVKQTEVPGTRYHESMMANVLADTPPL